MDTRSHSPVYDAFGDRAVGGRTRKTVTARARTAAVAIFWSVALLLVAGRVYQQNVASPGHAIELASR